jgi:hypothetical protein
MAQHNHRDHGQTGRSPREPGNQRVTMQKGCPAGSVRTRALSPCGW